jgi:prepilin-type processing-associated H-X9-DG protein
VDSAGPDFLGAQSWCSSKVPFQHRGGWPNGPGTRVNVTYFDGHAKSVKWAETLYPVNRNQWEIGDPDPPPTSNSLRCQDGIHKYDGYICPVYK